MFQTMTEAEAEAWRATRKAARDAVDAARERLVQATRTLTLTAAMAHQDLGPYLSARDSFDLEAEALAKALRAARKTGVL